MRSREEARKGNGSDWSLLLASELGRQSPQRGNHNMVKSEVSLETMLLAQGSSASRLVNFEATYFMRMYSRVFGSSPGLHPLDASGTLPHTVVTPQNVSRHCPMSRQGAGAVHEMARGREPLIQPMPFLYRDGSDSQMVTHGPGATPGQRPWAGFRLRALPPPPPVQSSPGVAPVSSSVASSQRGGFAESGR